MLTDPTAGAGYAFGQTLPSAHMTTIATQQPDAVDGRLGGTYQLANALTIADNGGSVVLGTTVEFANADYPILSSRSLSRRQPFMMVLNAASRWAFAAGLHWFQTDVSSGGPLILALPRLIDSSSLVSVTVRMHGSLHGSPNGDFPATMPELVLARGTDTDTGDTLASKSLSAATDFASTLGNYNDAWNVVLTPASPVAIDMSTGREIYVAISGEAGANAAAGLAVLGVTATFTVTRIRPG